MSPFKLSREENGATEQAKQRRNFNNFVRSFSPPSFSWAKLFTNTQWPHCVEPLRVPARSKSSPRNQVSPAAEKPGNGRYGLDFVLQYCVFRWARAPFFRSSTNSVSELHHHHHHQHLPPGGDVVVLHRLVSVK
uniref:Uncharacterized protein n=1 Tax=Anopheles maculatus TaxID=74869 RepID=A0A182S5F0_9DIPT